MANRYNPIEDYEERERRSQRQTVHIFIHMKFRSTAHMFRKVGLKGYCHKMVCQL
jgi:hypothetical protein